MKPLQRVSNQIYRQAIQDEKNQGRIPLAWFTWGSVTGHGWAFLWPWAQQALFPGKGVYGSGSEAARKHERFWILRLWPRQESHRHKNHSWDIAGRYWYGLVWRKSWGWRPRWRLLDPDLVTDDPGKADDWGDRPGEGW